MHTRSPILTGLLLASIASHSAAQPPGDLNPEDVRLAIRTGVDYLKSQQDARTGRWAEMPGFQGGVTALATLALLNAGVEPTDPAVIKALNHLRQIEPDKTYCLALKIMVLASATPKRDLAIIQQCVEQLEATQNPGPGDDAGGWSYPGAGADPSNSQFAVLALHEAQRAGARVSPDVWRLASGYWRRTQNDDGSWSYGGNLGPSGSMTCAGIAALVVTSEATSEGDARVEDGRVRCCLPQEDDDRIQRALDWMGRNFSVARNPSNDAVSAGWHYYYLYALERVGRLTAHRFIGKHDWYREGTQFVVRQQDPLSKFWTGGRSERNPEIGTSLALLFL
ncbi:MAG: terpene cyclase/mutase family protein, partial [Planctomycetales bacterium]|nr:terpene cyclase/mutase family protein [Planctomycetales bacterium]